MNSGGLQVYFAGLLGLAVVIVAAMKRPTPAGTKCRRIGGVAACLVFVAAASRQYPGAASGSDAIVATLTLLAVLVGMILVFTHNVEMG